MLPELANNSAYRLKNNKDFNFFSSLLEKEKKGESFALTPQENFGVDDLQMIEAVNILKDMTALKPAAAKKVAALIK